MSRSKDIAEILGATEAENTSNVSLGSGGGGVTSYTSLANLPLARYTTTFTPPNASLQG